MDGRANDAMGGDLSLVRTELMARMGPHARSYPERTEKCFPHILSRIADFWGSAQLDTYLKDLMITTRVGRQGFPPEIARELFVLAAAHERLGLSGSTAATGWGSIDDHDSHRRSSMGA